MQRSPCPDSKSKYAALPTAYDSAALETSAQELHDRALQSLYSLQHDGEREHQARAEAELRARRDLAIAQAMSWLSDHAPARSVL